MPARTAGQVQFCGEAAALTPENLSALQQQVRAVLRWFARAGHLDLGDSGDMARRAHWPLSANESGLVNDRRWPVSARTAIANQSLHYTFVRSAFSRASSTSMPR